MFKVYIVIFLLVSAAAFQAKSSEIAPRTIQVMGVCRKSVVADHFKVRFTAQALEKKSEVAAEKAQLIYEKLVNFTKDKYPQTITLKTIEISTQEEREWQKSKSVFVGFRSRLGIEAETSDSKALSELIGEAQKVGVSDIGQFESSASQSVLELNRKLCLSEAAQDALKKAKVLAEASQAKFVGLYEMREVSQDGPMVMSMAAEAVSRKSSPAIEKGQTELIYTLEAKYLIQ